jgi:hypothetical protein
MLLFFPTDILRKACSFIKFRAKAMTLEVTAVAFFFNFLPQIIST